MLPLVGDVRAASSLTNAFSVAHGPPPGTSVFYAALRLGDSRWLRAHGSATSAFVRRVRTSERVPRTGGRGESRAELNAFTASIVQRRPERGNVAPGCWSARTVDPSACGQRSAHVRRRFKRHSPMLGGTSNRSLRGRARRRMQQADACEWNRTCSFDRARPGATLREDRRRNDRVPGTR